MEQDIRKLFCDGAISSKKLPEQHRNEFLGKLNASKLKIKKKPSVGYVYKYAAVILIFFSIGYIVVNQFSTKVEVVVETELERQLKEVEQIYLKKIDQEWQSFVALASDENLIKRYDDKLKELDSDYHLISEQFIVEKNNISIIESLVNNLQTRLRLLKDIQEHINLLNQKTKSYETITL